MTSRWVFTSAVSGSAAGATRRRHARPALAAAFALTATAGLSGSLMPSATAAPDPCAASEVARTVAMVATHTGNYLEANPQANRAITTISQQQDGPGSIAALKAYFDANPRVAGDIQRLQQPLVTLSGECKLPVTLPQVFGLMQAAQQSPAVSAAQSPTVADGGPSALPGAAPGMR